MDLVTIFFFGFVINIVVEVLKNILSTLTSISTGYGPRVRVEIKRDKLKNVKYKEF